MQSSRTRLGRWFRRVHRNTLDTRTIDRLDGSLDIARTMANDNGWHGWSIWMPCYWRLLGRLMGIHQAIRTDVGGTMVTMVPISKGMDAGCNKGPRVVVRMIGRPVSSIVADFAGRRLSRDEVWQRRETVGIRARSALPTRNYIPYRSKAIKDSKRSNADGTE